MKVRVGLLESFLKEYTEERIQMSETMTENTTAEESSDTLEVASETESRPEWLPEKFKSPEDLAKAYGELETWRMKTKEEALALFKEEVSQEQSNIEGLPDNPAKYEFKYDTSLLPEGINIDPSESDPMLDWWREHCFNNKLPQETFESGINAFIKADLETVSNPDVEISKLGERGEQRFQSVIKWLNGTLSVKAMDAINKQPMNAEYIEALEEIIEKTTGRVPETISAASAQPILTISDLRQMQSQPGYINGTDPVLIKKVQEGYARLSL